MGDAGAGVDLGLELLERHLGLRRQAAPQRVLRLVRARQVLAVILVDGAQIGAELMADRRPDHKAAVEEGAVVIGAAVGILGIGFDQLAAHQAAIGGAVIDGTLRLADALDEELARLLGILRRHLHPVALAPVARRHPAVAALHREGVFGEIALAAGRGRRHHGRTAVAEDDEVAVPVLRHGGQHIGAAREMLGIAGRDLGDRGRTGHGGGSAAGDPTWATAGAALTSKAMTPTRSGWVREMILGMAFPFSSSICSQSRLDVD